MSRSELLPRPFLANPCVFLTVPVSPPSRVVGGISTLRLAASFFKSKLKKILLKHLLTIKRTNAVILRSTVAATPTL